MAFLNKSPLIQSSVMIRLISKNPKVLEELKTILTELEKDPSHNGRMTQFPTRNRNEIYLSPLFFDKLCKHIHRNYVAGKKYNQIDTFEPIKVDLTIMFNRFSNKNGKLIFEGDEKEDSFDDLLIGNSEDNITYLLNKNIFFNAKMLDSKQGLEEEYRAKVIVANTIRLTFLNEMNGDQKIKKQLATIPTLDEFVNQDTNAVYIPAFHQEKQIYSQSQQKPQPFLSNSHLKFQITDENEIRRVDNTKKQETTKSLGEKKPANNKITIKPYTNNTHVNVHTTTKVRPKTSVKQTTSINNNSLMNEKQALNTLFNSDQKDIAEALRVMFKNNLLEEYQLNETSQLFKTDESLEDVSKQIDSNNFQIMPYVLSILNDKHKQANEFIKSIDDYQINQYNQTVQKMIVETLSKIIKESASFEDKGLDTSQLERDGRDYFDKETKRVTKSINDRRSKEVNTVVEQLQAEFEARKQQEIAKINGKYDNALNNSISAIKAQAQQVITNKKVEQSKWIENEIKKRRSELMTRLKVNVKSLRNDYQAQKERLTATASKEFSKAIEQDRPKIISEANELVRMQMLKDANSDELDALNGEGDDDFDI